MSLAFLGSGLFWTGLLALAGGLFLAQRLRVRHRRVPVVTSLFWNEAREESRARILVRRFRHPWAYALILGIAGLTWLALAGPTADDPTAPRWVLVLDAGGEMQRQGGFDEAVAALTEDLAAIPPRDREVLIDDGEPRRLLAPGENGRLLQPRLTGLEAQPAPSRLGEIVATLSREAAAGRGRQTRVLVYGRARLSAEEAADLPESLRVETRTDTLGESEAKPLVSRLGAAPAVSGAWDRVDLLVGVTGEASPVVTLDGVPLDLVATRDAGPWIARDLPARGGVVEARIDGSDGEAKRFVLPKRRRLRVAIAPGAPEALRQIVTFDPGLELVTADADADLDLGFSEPRGARSGLTLAAVANGAVLELNGEGADRHGVEMRSLLAEYAARPEGPRRVLAIASPEAPSARLDPALLSGDDALTDTAALPLLVSRTLRWLGRDRAFTRFARTGEALAQAPAGVWTDEAGRAHPTLGLALRPRRAGVYRHAEGTEVAVSDTVPASTAPAVEAETSAAAMTLPGTGADWIAIIVLIVLALLGLEWALVQRGRMP